MAFNPFDVFRRNQRILFAVLTVFVMFMFVLSFGRGDFFDWIPRWLGSKTRTGEAVAVIDGTKVTTGDLARVDTNRIFANTYMTAAAGIAADKLAKYVQDGVSRVSTGNRPDVQQFLTARQSGYMSPSMMQRLQFAQLAPGRFPEPTFDERMTDVERTIGVVGNRLLAAASAPGLKEDDQNVIRAALDLMQLDVNGGGARPYFSNQPNANNRDRVDFLLWLHKADDLGITYTPADLGVLLRDEFAGRLATADWEQAAAALGGKAGFSNDVLERALVDEFKVRAAQAAVLGSTLVRGGPLAKTFDSPYDYYEFYKDQTSPARFGVIGFPVENFLDKVAGTPTEADLRAIFGKYRNKEPNPESPEPGLREPRRLKLGWLEATGKEPFYTAAANDAFPKVEAHAKLFAVLAGATSANLGVLAVIPLGNLVDPALQAAYDATREQFRRDLDGEWYTKAGNPWSNVRPVDTSVVRPATLAAAVAATAGGLLTGSAWPSAPLAVEQLVAVVERNARASALAPLFLPAVSVADKLGAVASHLARVPQPLPLAVLRAQLVTQVKEDLARKLANEDLQKFQKDLTELGEKLTKTESAKLEAARAEAQAFADKFVKERGLKAGASQAFHDQYTMGQDPGLATLKDKMAGPHGASADLLQFGRRFFFDVDFSGKAKPAAGLFLPQPYPMMRLMGPSADEPAFLVWRTAEQEAFSPKDFNAPGVKAKAEAVWRELKARELAKKAADELAKECGSLGDGLTKIYQNLRDKEAAFASRFPTPEARARVSYFEVDGVAPLSTGALPLPGRESVSPFFLAPSTNIPYPTFQMTDELLAARKKPLSTAVAMVDQPQDRYYVAVLLNKAERSPDEFALTVYGSQLFGDLGMAISRRHQGELQRSARDTALALLKAEFNYTQENAKLLDQKSSDGIE